MRVVSIAFFILFVPCVAGATARSPYIEGMNGIASGEDTSFQIIDSEYLNINVESTEVIKLRVESVPKVISMRLKSVSALATSTQLTITGLLPSTLYYRYEDTLRNLVATSSDENGSYVYEQDISKPHIVFIQPRKSTKFIQNDATGGDCASLGTWDPATLTCTLTADIAETIEIDSDGVTLDGGGHIQDGSPDLVDGVYLNGRTNVTIKNLHIQNFSYGVNINSSSNTHVENNIFVDNGSQAVVAFTSNANTILGNTVSLLTPSRMRTQGFVFYGSNDNSFRDNTISLDAWADGSGGHQGMLLFDSNRNEYRANTVSDTYQGILLFNSNDTIVRDNTIKHTKKEGFLSFSHSSGNQVYHNNFINNWKQVVEYSVPANTFNLLEPEGGNYFDTFDEPSEGCLDANLDNFCDAPYSFFGGQDTLPWTKLDGWKVPPAPKISNVLFLPGIEGSRLYEGTGCGKEAEEKLWEPYDSLWKAFWGAGDAKVKDLFLDQTGSSVCSDIYVKKNDIIDSVGGSAIYASLITEMNGLKSDGTLNDWKPVAYDWRLSLDDLLTKGIELNSRIYYATTTATSTPYIEQALRSLAASSKTGKVSIVAHSNGGLLAKALLNKLGGEASKSLVDKVVMVGVPQSGAPEALGITLVGHNAGIYSSGFPVVSNVVARELAQNSPMAYHLLPSQNYFDSVMNDAAHPVARFAGDGYPKEISAYGPVIGDLTELDDFLLAKDGGREKPVASDLSSAEILNESLIYGANDQHDTLDTWVPPAGIEVSQIAGWGADTVAGIDFYTLSGVSALSSLAPVRMYKPIFTEDGDGTVPVPSALLMSTSTNVKRYWVDLFTYNNETHSARKHKDLFEIPSLEDFIKNIIKSSTSTLPAYISSTQPLSETGSKKLTFFLHSPLTLELTDASGNITGLAEDGSMTQDIPDSSYGEFGEVKYVTVPEGNPYTLTMHGQDNGTFSLDLQESSGGIVTNSSTIASIPTTASTLASLTITNGIDTASPLTVDKNGDGKNIFTVTPKVGETVNYEPPASAPVVHSAGGRRVSTSNPVPSPIETIIAPVMSPAVAIVPTTVVSADTHQIKKKSPTPVRTEAQKKALNIAQTASVYDASQQPVLNKLGEVVYYSLHRFWTGLQRIFHLK